MANALCLLNDLCRLCLNAPGKHNILETNTLIQDIFAYTGILQVGCHDKLPRTICISCMYKIEAAKDLKEYATKNDIYMRSLLDPTRPSIYKVTRPKMEVKDVDEDIVSSSTESNSSTSQGSNSESTPTSTKTVNSKVLSASSPVNKHTNTQTERPKIAVRSLDDINSGRYSSTVTSSKKDKISKKTKKTKKRSSKNSISVSVSSQSKKSNKHSKAKSRDHSEFKCDICKKTFLTSKKLYLHQRSHTKNLHCPLDGCEKRFATKGDLQKHTRAHTGEKPYQCDLCEKRFTQRVTLKSHRVAIHEAKMEVM